MFSLQDKVAIITGGSSGIGAEICDLFVEQGARVINFDPKQGDGDHLQWLKVDIGSSQEVKRAVEAVWEQHGRMDILVNNAGISLIGNIEETSEEDFDRIFQINVKGIFNCLSVVIPKMKQSGQGVVLNMASVAATMGLAQRFAYSATKGAVLSMTLSLAKDYLSYNIRCNSISPARVHTPFVDHYLDKYYPGQQQEMYKKLSATQPVGRMGKPEEIAALALYLCSDEASFITGTNYPIDGGFINLNT